MVKAMLAEFPFLFADLLEKVMNFHGSAHTVSMHVESKQVPSDE